MWKSLDLIRVIETSLAIIFLVLIDQSMKIFISKIMLNNGFEDMQLLPFLNIVFVRNTGVSFGMFSEWGILGRYFSQYFQ